MDRLVTDTGINIDLEEGIPIPLNLSIADFKEPDKRQRNFSKEITLPGTANNLAFFSSAFNLTRTGGSYNFSSNQKVNCTYFKKNTPILQNAVMKLNKAIIQDGVVSFKVTLFSDVVDIFLLLSNISIRDLGWSAYNHTLNNTNIINSWTTPLGTGYYYPLIERKQRATISRWQNTEMVPYVHFVDIFKRCLDFVGQKFTSNWLAQTDMKSILFGFGGGTYVDAAISPTEQNDRKVLTNNGVTTYTHTTFAASTPVAVEGPAYFPPIPFEQNFTVNEVQDILSQMSNTSFTAARNGSMRLEIIGQLRMRYQGPDASWASGCNRLLYYTKNGTQYPITDLIQTAADQVFNLNIGVELDVQQGDFIQLHLGAASGQFTWPIPDDSSTEMTFYLTAPTPLQINYISTQNAITEGSTVEVRRFMPDMNCSEFLLGAIRFGNLMISDPDLYGVVKIEPIKDFYQPTTVFTDIAQEVDHSKDIEVRPSANEYAKRLRFIFKKGTESDAKTYEDKWGTPYGDLEFDQESYFAKGEQKIELPWGTIIPYQIYAGVIIPRFVDIDDTGAVKPTKGVPRIMYRNGMKPGNWQLKKNVGLDNLTQYPSVHHFDNWRNPTKDLNWQLVSEVYYVASAVTTINTYSLYYERFIEEIVSGDGKYVQLYRKMNNTQIKNLDWTKLLMWNGALFRFNKVVDFDSEITEVTKIEMIKVLRANNPRSRGRVVIPIRAILAGNVINSPSGDGVGTPVIAGGKNNSLTYVKTIQG